MNLFDDILKKMFVQTSNNHKKIYVNNHMQIIYSRKSFIKQINIS